MPSGRWRDSDRAARLPGDWRSRLRPLVFATYGDTCHWCGLPGADTIDHVQAGDNHSLENLRPIHDRVPPHCHREKTAREGVEARARRRAEATMPREPHPGLD